MPEETAAPSDAAAAVEGAASRRAADGETSEALPLFDMLDTGAAAPDAADSVDPFMHGAASRVYATRRSHDGGGHRSRVSHQAAAHTLSSNPFLTPGGGGGGSVSPRPLSFCDVARLGAHDDGADICGASAMDAAVDAWLCELGTPDSHGEGPASSNTTPPPA
jgi:hypothetical protein